MFVVDACTIAFAAAVFFSLRFIFRRYCVVDEVAVWFIGGKTLEAWKRGECVVVFRPLPIVQIEAPSSRMVQQNPGVAQ